MGILIKGVKMPTGEDEGMFIAVYDGKAYIIGTKETREAVELPDHGDLIDRDMLIGGFADWYIQESPMYLGDNNVVAETIGDTMKAIEAAPAVIPAERSEE